MMSDKASLRAMARAARHAFAPTAHPIAPIPAFAALLRPAMTVAGYAAIGSEADPAALIRAAREMGCTIALPHIVDRATPMRFVAWPDDAPLTDGPYRLRQPAAASAPCRPDLILTPLVAFDRALNRLGQGAGHYDRAFAILPEAIRIGVGFGVQEMAMLPVDPWDVPLHAIITEREWITP